MKNLELLKPIVFVDLETTGLNPSSDRIVEVSLLKIHADGHEDYLAELINPGIPIPEEATAIHGISDSDVAGKPTFKHCASQIKEFIGDHDIGGFNVKRFDLPLLETEFRRAAIKFSRGNRAIVDAQVIYHLFEKRDLEAAYYKYCGKQLDKKHRSDVDVRATVEILDAQVSFYTELPRDTVGLHQLCCAPGESNWIDASGRFVAVEGEITFNFGKYKGKRLKDIAKKDPSYLDWILHNPDFSLETQEIVLKALDEI